MWEKPIQGGFGGANLHKDPPKSPSFTSQSAKLKAVLTALQETSRAETEVEAVMSVDSQTAILGVPFEETRMLSIIQFIRRLREL